MATSCETPSRFQNLKRILDRLPEQWNRRSMRKALRNSDIYKIKSIISKGYDVNAVINDVYQDTALTWSVKNGHLEMVEFLVNFPGCDLDKKDRSQHSALDEAFKRWLGAAVVSTTPSGSVHSTRSNDDTSLNASDSPTAAENDPKRKTILSNDKDLKRIVSGDSEKYSVRFSDSNEYYTQNTGKANGSPDKVPKKMNAVNDKDLKRTLSGNSDKCCGKTPEKEFKKSNSVPYSRESVKFHLGVRYRILKGLLEAGASAVSSPHLDMAVFQTLSASLGQLQLTKLSGLVAEKGTLHVRSVLFSVLVTYRTTHDCLKCLLEAGADPRYYLTKEPSRPFMPMENALLLLRVCNDETLLSRIECDTTGNLSRLDDQRIDQLLLVLRLLVVCGHSLQLYVMNFLQEHRQNFYVWVVRQRSRPRPLQSLARIKIRKLLKSNVLYSHDKLTRIPEELKQFLLLSEWLIPKKKQGFGQ